VGESTCYKASDKLSNKKGRQVFCLPSSICRGFVCLEEGVGRCVRKLKRKEEEEEKVEKGAQEHPTFKATLAAVPADQRLSQVASL